MLPSFSYCTELASKTAHNVAMLISAGLKIGLTELN